MFARLRIWSGPADHPGMTAWPHAPLSYPANAEYSFAISLRDPHEFCYQLPALSEKRAQGRPGARCTRGLACNVHKEVRTRAYRFSGNTPAFPAQWLYGLLRDLPGERLFCHRHPQEALASQRLDASTAASEPHDFAVRSSCARQSQHQRPPHLDPRS